MAHMFYNNLIMGENSYRKFCLIELEGSGSSIIEDESGEHVRDLLPVMKSFAAVGGGSSSLTLKKGIIQFLIFAWGFKACNLK